MGAAQLLQMVIPLMLGIGGLAAWRATRRAQDAESKSSWHDDSLDDWRQQRDAEQEAERAARAGKSDSDE